MYLYLCTTKCPNIFSNDLLVNLVDALKGAYKFVSRLLGKEPISNIETSENALNCSDFSTVLGDYEQVYIRTLQIESLAREYDENSGEKDTFSPDPSIIHDIFSSLHGLNKYLDSNPNLSKIILANGEECPNEETMADARQLNGEYT